MESVNDPIDWREECKKAIENIDRLNAERERLELQVSDLHKTLAKGEADYEKTMLERDGWEEALTQLADDAVCEEEWSNLHAHGDCITNLWDAKVKEANRLYNETKRQLICDGCGFIREKCPRIVPSPAGLACCPDCTHTVIVVEKRICEVKSQAGFPCSLPPGHEGAHQMIVGHNS